MAALRASAVLSDNAAACPQVWFYNEAGRRWEQEPGALAGHTGWVRDVAWAPNLGLNANTVASASQVLAAAQPRPSCSSPVLLLLS